MPNNLQPDPQGMGDIQAAIAAGAALGDPRQPVAEPGAGVFTVLPNTYRIESLENYLPRPLRIDQKVILHDADSFIAYVNDFRLAGPSRIFFDVGQEQFNAIIDYHEIQTPSWCDHTAVFKPRKSVEFETWMATNRKAMTQVDFARFLEENLPDVVEPESAVLLQVALTFEAKKSVEFASGVRLNKEDQPEEGARCRSGMG